MLNSNFSKLGNIQLPQFQGRQCYMHSFDIANPEMKAGYEDFLEPVQNLLKAAGVVHGIAHMTVDEKILYPGQTQRRPGPHVDGCFIPAKMMWGQGGWNHTCNNVPLEKPSRMSVIVASSFSACRAWEGNYNTEPNHLGGLEHIQTELGEGKILEANVGYLLSPDCIHESLLVKEKLSRTFLRIALPLEYQ